MFGSVLAAGTLHAFTSQLGIRVVAPLTTLTVEAFSVVGAIEALPAPGTLLRVTIALTGDGGGNAALEMLTRRLSNITRGTPTNAR